MSELPKIISDEEKIERDRKISIEWMKFVLEQPEAREFLLSLMADFLQTEEGKWLIKGIIERKLTDAEVEQIIKKCDAATERLKASNEFLRANKEAR